ncbi:hemX domain-containing protein [Marinomonas ushuaiensis DSM 15871]|uniref:HemX domain-containing protein n=1 Tax=Marinomonas ushuaiensis DSM 15871 TaxID=1122207 RepID=X7E2Y6_9GAMM|nr:uroporphyrinogen-III C-methyltransferase [Marinomonas ushuaiensis]ETX09521.1 hemX domain-containing protein [Marinomonas ushuaiensis DSM 15871]
MTENKKQETSDIVGDNTTQVKSSSDTPSDQSKQNPSNKEKTQKKTPSHAKTKLFVTASFSLSVIALAISGWLYYQSMQNTSPKDITQLKTQQSNLDKKISANTLNQVQLNTMVEKIINTDRTTQAEKQQLVIQQTQQDERLLSLEAKLNRLNNTTKEDWKLAEAEYLIRLANQRLLLESDSNGAVTLLNNADDILNELEDPIVFSTRKALAKDIQALGSISPFDLEGAYLKLNALYESVTSLPQREPSKEWMKNTTQAKPVDNSTTGKIESTFKSFWQSIRSLVVINYDNKPIKALLPPAEYQELITGLHLQLDIAQVALIKGEPVIYQQALSRVAKAITEQFDTQTDTVVSFLANLTIMQQLNPSPDFPLPRESLLAMKSLMKDWNNRGINTSEAPLSTDTENTNILEKSNTSEVNTGDNT